MPITLVAQVATGSWSQPTDQRLGGQMEDNLRPFGSEDPADRPFVANIDAMVLDR